MFLDALFVLLVVETFSQKQGKNGILMLSWTRFFGEMGMKVEEKIEIEFVFLFVLVVVWGHLCLIF